MLIDTHAHLWFPDYYPPEADQLGYYDDLDVVMARAKSAGVGKMVVPGTDVVSSHQAIELAKKYPGVIYAAVGVHPEETVENDLRFSIQDLRDTLSINSGYVVAIGEIGTDNTIKPLDNYTIERQQELFREQCELALQFDLPIIVHTRESLKEALEVLDALPSMPRGQFHCFSHDEEGVRQVLERGFYVSFAGNITWSKRVSRLVAQVPDNRLLLETDSPLMMPRVNREVESHEVKRNEPANVVILAEKIADLRGQVFEEVAKITTENAIRLFRL